MLASVPDEALAVTSKVQQRISHRAPILTASSLTHHSFQLTLFFKPSALGERKRYLRLC
jgi:hypothetical protein